MALLPRKTIYLESGKCTLKELGIDYCVVHDGNKLYKMEYGRLIRKNLKIVREISSEIDRFDIGIMRRILNIIAKDAIKLKSEADVRIPNDYVIYIYHLSRLSDDYVNQDLTFTLRELFSKEIENVLSDRALAKKLADNYIINSSNNSGESIDRWDPEDLARGMDMLPRMK